ncbi:helix-turn-helix domain-containing protein [Flavivirga jejuensis]|uniref:Helix-turn-helix transcriptional regulator n=1 Tax=Flavivirga jejuensis TaxID=870487 RepID=A0ABT8WVD2_9FLAO|nr:helix-turn-helix transcriptional regulator [Flavivirga jejuensis]MDO5977123.1 helix-turn-helix transcriptional regulator [Flavivirga jejuensis]
MKKLYKQEVLTLFGKRIKELRLERNLSYRKMAKECDLGYSKISKIEKGEVEIRFYTILEISIALKVHPKELFDFEHKWKDEAFM